MDRNRDGHRDGHTVQSHVVNTFTRLCCSHVVNTFTCACAPIRASFDRFELARGSGQSRRSAGSVPAGGPRETCSCDVALSNVAQSKERGRSAARPGELSETLYRTATPYRTATVR